MLDADLFVLHSSSIPSAILDLTSISLSLFFFSFPSLLFIHSTLLLLQYDRLSNAHAIRPLSETRSYASWLRSLPVLRWPSTRHASTPTATTLSSSCYGRYGKPQNVSNPLCIHAESAIFRQPRLAAFNDRAHDSLSPVPAYVYRHHLDQLDR